MIDLINLDVIWDNMCMIDSDKKLRVSEVTRINRKKLYNDF